MSTIFSNFFIFIFFDEKTKITITGGNFELFIKEGKHKALNNIRIVENENFFNLESLDYSYKQKKGFGSKLFAQTKDGTTYRSKSVKFDLNKQIFVYNMDTNIHQDYMLIYLEINGEHNES